MTTPEPYRFCPHCATPLTPWLQDGRLRLRCPACGFIHYRNPTAGVAVVTMAGGKILLGRRAVGHSYAGAWCIPCGHVEWDEDIRAAGRREFFEETGLQVELGGVIAVHSNFHNPRQHTVGVWFRAQVVEGTLRPGDDLDRVGYFPLSAPPQPLAFPTDQLVLDQLLHSTPGD